MNKESRASEVTICHEGSWLHFCERRLNDRNGAEQRWEFIRRAGTGGACCVIAHIPGPARRVLCVKQFRPALARYCIEFPAGLLDSGESFEACARRELKEETGWEGCVLNVDPPIFSSPGMTDEWVVLVHMEATERHAPDHGDLEEIETLEIPERQLRTRLQEYHDAGCALDSKLWTWAVGRTMP